jgi:hypothetical protein
LQQGAFLGLDRVVEFLGPPQQMRITLSLGITQNVVGFQTIRAPTRQPVSSA